MSAMSKNGEPGGAHKHGPPTPFDESVELQVALNKEARADPNSIAARQQAELEADLKAIRERKARRRARNPYDFS